MRNSICRMAHELAVSTLCGEAEKVFSKSRGSVTDPRQDKSCQRRLEKRILTRRVAGTYEVGQHTYSGNFFKGVPEGKGRFSTKLSRGKATPPPCSALFQNFVSS